MRTLRTCPEGHQYYKSSDCPTCPVCEDKRRPDTGFLSLVPAPARRALQGAGITSLKQLSRFSEKDITALHGMGPKATSILKSTLHLHGLSFANERH